MTTGELTLMGASTSHSRRKSKTPAGHRHYAAELGRFISRDPIGFQGGLNLFGTAFGNNPVTFVDPSGLDIRVLQAAPLLNGRAGGPIYIPTGWKSYSTYEAFVAAAKQAAFDNIQFQEIIFEGHGLHNQMGCNPRDDNHMDGGAIVYYPKRQSQKLQIFLENKQWIDFESLHLENLGVRKITLRGCGTAGGYTDSMAPGLAKKTGYPLGYVTNREMYPLTDDNVSAAISSAVPGAVVEGMLGPGAKDFKDWSVTPTRSYQGGVPIDGPLR